MANWDQITSRGNVQDRRGAVGAVGGISGLGLVLGLGYLLLGGDLGQALNLATSVAPAPAATEVQEFDDPNNYDEFAATVLGSNDDFWTRQFQERQAEYEAPTLVLFRRATRSACGGATSQVGPHYCPLDKTIYLDETFFDELTGRYGARGGDVAEAYVIAHEVGHHVQNIEGTLARSREQGGREAAIGVELQADCYAGAWAGTVEERGVIESGEIVEALDAAAAVGDDRIQERVTGQINPETWTHGSSAQRQEAFTRGFESQDPGVCDYV